MIADQEARDLARLSLDRNVVVEAGAGTGKTALLVDRILFSILTGKTADLTRLVALTFTKKAAGEMKVRLCARLEELARPAAGQEFLKTAQQRFGARPEDVRVRALEALQALDRAMISTIHSFAASLLRLYPVEAGVDPGFEVDEGQAFDSLFAERWPLWLDRELAADAPRRESWLEVLALAPLEDLRALAYALGQEGNRQGRLGATPALQARVRELARRVPTVALDKPKPKGRSKILESIDALARHLEELARAMDKPLLVPETMPEEPFFSAWPKGWEEFAGREIYEEAKALASCSSAASQSLAAKAAALVLPFCEEFRLEYRRRGHLGHDGTLALARALLRDFPQVRAELKSRFDAFLVDEFQDTDPLQGEILLFLAEESGSSAPAWRDIRAAPGRIFIVGDPKQSIYRFRGADLRAYEDFTGLLLGQGALRCELKTSFRSPPAIIDPVNAAFSALMKPEPGLQPRYLPISALPREGAPEEPAVVSVVLESEAGEGLNSEARAELEAAWMADWVLRNCPGRRRYRDVAVLLRTSTHLPAYLDALREAEIPYVVENDRYFFGKPETADFINLLKALDDPRDAVALAGLLRSPLCALPDRDLYELSRAKSLTYMKDPEAPLSEGGLRRAQGLFEILRGLRRRANAEPLGDFVWRVLQETCLLEHASTAYHGEQTAANLLKFLRLAGEAGARGATLKEFIGEAREAGENSARGEGESSLADEEMDAIRLLTIHKAKGLEYPVVLLPNLSAPKGHGQEKPAALWDWSEATAGLRLPKAKAADAAMAAIEAGQGLREEREAPRLLYVAMTRAKEKLILLGGVEFEKSSLAALLSAAGAWPGERALRVRPGFARARKAPAADREPLRRIAMSARRPEEARPLFSAPSMLKEEGGARGFKASADAALLGSLCHAALAAWDFGRGGDIAAVLRAASRPLAWREPGADWPALLDEAGKVLSAFLGSAFALSLAQAEILGRELPFSSPHEGGVMRGSMDLVYRRNGRVYIADYKTDRISPAQAEERAKSYFSQGEAYIDALERATGLKADFQVVFLRSGVMVQRHSSSALPR